MTDQSDNPIDDATLAGYLRGDCTEQDRRAIERWAAESLDRRRLLDALRQVWETEAGAPPSPDAARMWVALKRRTIEARPPIRLLPGTAPAQAWRRRLPAFATAAGLVLAAGAAMWLAPQRAAIAPAPMREVVTGKGQRAELRLGDGSQVVLGVESKLRFPADFRGGRRELELSGEAFFTVTHDATRPFVVYAGGTMTEDLGTEFVVRAYPSDAAVRVVVASGRVAVRRRGATTPATLLQRGDLATMRDAGAPAVEHGVALDSYTGWRDGRLVFRETPLADVVGELRRWFALDIRVQDAALDRVPVSGEFKDQSATEVLEILVRTVDLRYRRTADTVWLMEHPR